MSYFFRLSVYNLENINKGGFVMKGNTKTNKLGKVMAKLAIRTTQANANSACIFITHQPKLPETAKKLRKF